MPRIAFLVGDLFEDSEFLRPFERAREAGHETVVVGQAAEKQITGKNGTKLMADMASSDVSADEFDAVVIPGGYSPDKIRTDRKLVELVRTMNDSGKPVAAICHAGWMLAEADIVRGRRLTSFHSIRTDLVNAGADWVDEELVEDGNLITSRTPADLPAFCDAILNKVGAPV